MRVEYFYIKNKITKEIFDTVENKFYGSKQEPILELRQYLEGLILKNPKKFENCIIIDTSLNN